MVVRNRRGSLGVNVDYVVRDVAGDGNCYYRAVYQLIGGVPAARAALGIADTSTTEDAAIRDLRQTIARVLMGRGAAASAATDDARAAIDTLCELAAAGDDIAGELAEMYPFLTDDVCSATGRRRYRRVAEKIVRVDGDAAPPLYASALEHYIFQTLLGPTNISLLVLSAPSLRISARRREIWKNDLRTLLHNTATRRVAVLLNVANIHYQSFSFKGSDDDADHTILSRQKLLALLELSAPTPRTATI